MKTMAIACAPPLFSPPLNVNLTRLSSSLLLPFCHSSFSPTLSRCCRRPRFLTMASATQSSTQEKAARLPPVEEIRTFLDQSTRGMLSTFSQKHEGYPSGSMVDFACYADGSPILAVSSLAVHTKVIQLSLCPICLKNCCFNPKCSLLVAKDPEDRTDLVITLHGDAIPVSEKDITAVRTAYLAKLPDSFWVDFGDFQFMRIEPKVVRYVSGVATALLGCYLLVPFF
uniref:Pyridoxamine 5'-phosphate oxidase N-terminal domain-containing protein n=1 Tax=Salix viminalis TaxID=40686 RepID=A0A6N2M818_SALVM